MSLLGTKISNEELLIQVDDLLRSMPTSDEMRWEQSALPWLGRLKAVIAAWNSLKTLELNSHLNNLRDLSALRSEPAYNGVVMLVHEARHDLVMQTQKSASVVVPHEATFQYFDGLRKVVEMAKQQILFVDPYLDASFVASYLPHVAAGVKIRLLARHKLPALVSAADAFAKQHDSEISIRSSETLHDRYVFIDRRICYQSGASFKDGAKNAPTTITEITDAFDATLQTFESIWDNARVER